MYGPHPAGCRIMCAPLKQRRAEFPSSRVRHNCYSRWELSNKQHTCIMHACMHEAAYAPVTAMASEIPHGGSQFRWLTRISVLPGESWSAFDKWRKNLQMQRVLFADASVLRMFGLYSCSLPSKADLPPALPSGLLPGADSHSSPPTHSWWHQWNVSGVCIWVSELLPSTWTVIIWSDEWPL